MTVTHVPGHVPTPWRASLIGWAESKDSDSAHVYRMAYCGLPAITERVMSERTCAACDCELDANSIDVSIGGVIVEVCCEECAQQLNEAHVAAAAAEAVHA
jgi:hypothetical protein